MEEASSAALRDAISRLAPGTVLREGLERILRGRTGGLIVLGFDERVEAICDGGFELDVEFAPTRLRELSKMDGAVVLSTDGKRIVRANVQLVPDPKIPTVESGTRHRAAERTSVQTDFPVVSVSQSMSIVSVAGNSAAALRFPAARLDAVTRQLSIVEIEDFATLRDALTVVQRLEMVRRISVEIEQDVLELGTDGRQLALQLEELVGDHEFARQLLVRDYLAAPEPPSGQTIDETLEAIDALTDVDLLDLTTLAQVFGYPANIEALDMPMNPRGYRVLTHVPRLAFHQVHRLVGSFGTLQGVLAATAPDLEAVDGIGQQSARHLREGLSRIIESSLAGS